MRSNQRMPLLVLAAVMLFGCGQELPTGIPEGTRFHLQGWVSESAHLPAFYASPLQCGRCHGDDLSGGLSLVSCDQCHSGWQTDCSFCHGGTDSSSGAPPEGVNGQTARSDPAVGAHTAHLSSGAAHLAYPCRTCHAVPASIWDPGHLDQSPGAEVLFSAPNDESSWYDEQQNNCASLYCHGNGRQPSGGIKWTAVGPLACDACHGDDVDASGMSGKHGSHLNLGLLCADCHAQVVDSDGSMIDKRVHVNGERDVELSIGTWDSQAQSCDSTCHAGPPRVRDW